MGAYLTTALNEQGVRVKIDNVVNGKECCCICPHCGAPLYAKNEGHVRVHHFAHAKDYHDCKWTDESERHFLAKKVLSECGCIMLPGKAPDRYPSGLVTLRDVRTETRDNALGLIPDAEGLMDNGERLLVEFFVTHKVDEKKRLTIIDNRLKCVEVDIRSVPVDEAATREFLTCSSDSRGWIVPQGVSMTGSSLGYSHEELYVLAHPDSEEAKRFALAVSDECARRYASRRSPLRGRGSGNR